MKVPTPHIDSLCYPYLYDGDQLPVLFSDSTFLVHTTLSDTPHTFKGTNISQRPKEMNMIFVIFFFCFILLAFAVSSKGKRMFSSIKSNFFQAKARSSIFSETIGNNLSSSLLFIIQAVLLSAVFMLIYYSSTLPYTPHAIKALTIIGLFSVLFVVYLLLKWCGYKLMSYVFFNRDTYKQWMNGWRALLSLHALVMLVPTVLFVYVPFLFDTCLYLVCTWFILSRLIILYKSYAIFFNGIDRLHYLFLYLCTQEIIPLFLLYKGCSYVFNILDNCVLWV